MLVCLLATDRGLAITGSVFTQQTSQARLYAKLHGRNSCHFLVDIEAPPTRDKEGRTDYEHFPIKGRYAVFLLAGIAAELAYRMCSVDVNVPS